MLVVAPERRFTVDQCLSHPWLQYKPPGPNDSTGGLVGGIATLEMNRRGVRRERTLLSSLNEVQKERVPADGKTVAVFSKNKGRVTNANAIGREAGPAHKRDEGEFMQMGGKGDQELFGNDSNSIYSKADMIDDKKAKGH